VRRLILCACVAAAAGACINFNDAEATYCADNPAACDAGAVGGGANSGGGAGTGGGSTAGGGSATGGGTSTDSGIVDSGVPCTDPSDTNAQCGGTTCPPCDVDKLCNVDTDCQTTSCQNNFCALVSGGGNEPTPVWQFVGIFDLGGSSTVSSGRTSFAIARIGPRFYLAGGQVLNTGGSQTDTATAALLTYDAPVSVHPTASTGVNGFNPTMAAARTNLGGAVSDAGLFYAFAGFGAIGGNVKAVEAYNPSTNTWSSAGSVPSNEYCGSTVLQFPGAALLVQSSSPLLRYDFQGNFVDAGPAPPGNVAAAAVAPNGDVYLFANDTTTARDTLTLRHGGSAWQPAASAPVPMTFAVATYAPDDRFYVVAADGLVQAFRPTGDWASVSPTNEGHGTGALLTGEDGRPYVFFGLSRDGGFGFSQRVEAYGPTLDVSPAAALAGSIVRVTGNNFAAHASVKVYWGPLDGGVLLKTTTTDDAGVFLNLPVTVPAGASGSTVFTAIDSRARFPAFIPFTVQ
jgi:hypothetical protein